MASDTQNDIPCDIPGDIPDDIPNDVRGARGALVAAIVEKEWDFLQQVNNRGGRAGCQDSPGTFRLMRQSQFACWPVDALESYNADLDLARNEGRNTVTEKYAWMMRRTWPEEFADIESGLPPVSGEKRRLVRDIVDVNVAWEEECDRKYPNVRAKGRPLRSSADSRCVTSFETYLEGELFTCGEETLKRLRRHVLEARERGENLAEKNLDCMARGYGYASVAELEEKKATGRA